MNQYELNFSIEKWGKTAILSENRHQWFTLLPEEMDGNCPRVSRALVSICRLSAKTPEVTRLLRTRPPMGEGVDWQHVI